MTTTVLEILNGPWAITPEMLDEIHRIYLTRAAGRETEWLQAYRQSEDHREPPRGYSIENGVAILPIEGVLGRRMSLMSAMSGGASYDLIGQSIEAALKDDRVHGIVQTFHSPGGIAYGMDTLSKKIRAASAVKPIASWTDGMMASAAYGLGMSAGSGVYIGGEASDVGSIGVVAKHIDVSGAEAKAGIKTTEITAGKYKRIASEYEPLTKEGRKSMQDWVDGHMTAFVNNVAEMRGVSVDKVLADMADGRVFTGRKAIDAGLVDDVATLDAVVEKVRVEASTRKSNHQRERIRTMNREELKASNAALYEEVKAEGVAEGVASERARISTINQGALPGHEDLVAQCIEQGTPVAESLLAINKAERERMKDVESSRLAEGSVALPNPGAASPDGDSQKEKPKAADLNQRAQVYKAKKAAEGITVTQADAVCAVLREGN